MNGYEVKMREDQMRLHIFTQKITHYEFSEQLGFADNHFSAVLTGKMQPSGRMIANVLGIVGGTFEDWFEVVPKEAA